MTGKIFLIFSILLCLHFFAQGQTTEDLNNIRVDEITDDQLRRFVAETDRLGISDDQLDQLAVQRGMSPIELVKLKERAQALRKAMTGSKNLMPNRQTTSLAGTKIDDSLSRLEKSPLSDFNSVFSELKTNNFGYFVFNNPRLSFEPNLSIPTPKNYLLSAEDELLIDVSGYSEANYKLKVTPEGLIRIPVAGSVQVNGLTIEQARKAIIRKLSSTIYYDIRTGRTSVEVTLGAVRSIKVTIVGEAVLPGTYTLPSLASAYNALYACGGPNENGSYRDIQVIRNNKVIAVIDVYQYLLNGNKKNDVHLLDQDLIKVNTYKVRVTLKGEVKKPGIYDVVEGETIAQVVEYAGGFTDNAYTSRIQAYRNTDKDRLVTTISEQELDKMRPMRGDTYIIGKILNRLVNRVSIRGAVYRPGDYELKKDLMLLQLINLADGIREDAFTSRIAIHRLRKDLSPEIIDIDLGKLLSGNGPDVLLQPEDRIIIYSKFDLKEGYYVTITGEVATPGIFLYEKGIAVADLVMMAGGLLESASMKKIEISRRIQDGDPAAANAKTAVIFEQTIRADLTDSAEISRFELQPFDEVSIHPAPGYYVQKNVVIEGEVFYNGTYSLESKKDRISDLVKRAGGLTPEAYLPGAVLVRSRKFSRTEQRNYEKGVASLLKQNLQAGTPPAILQQDLASIGYRTSDLVGIDLPKILANPTSEFDLLLNDGDTLRIPKQLQTVRVDGEVLYPTLIRYQKNFGFKDYIIGAGGFSERSAKKKAYVVYANGEVKGTKSFLFFKDYPNLSPGAEIFVPLKREKERLRTAEVLTIIVSLATLLLISYNTLH